MSEVLKTDDLGKHKKLICMVGLPYSGKSTEAKEFNFPIVNPDSIRVALHGKKFIPSAEPHVWAIARTMVVSLFLAGHDNVVLDATCTTDERRGEWLSKQWATEFCPLFTSADVCKQRAVAAGDEGMVPIIDKMNLVFTPPEQ
jgi:predicted kinase